MRAVLVLGLAFLAVTTAAYVNRKNNLEDELLQDLESYIAERELADENEEDKRIEEILQHLDERSLNLLASTIDLDALDDEPTQDSVMKREEKVLAYSLLLADNPELREVLGEDENGRVDVEARKLKGWLKKLVDKVKALARAVACRVCNGTRPSFIKAWVWNAFKWLFKKYACKNC